MGGWGGWDLANEGDAVLTRLPRGSCKVSEGAGAAGAAGSGTGSAAGSCPRLAPLSPPPPPYPFKPPPTPPAAALLAPRRAATGR